MKRVMSKDIRDMYLKNNGGLFDFYELEILDINKFHQAIGERVYDDGKDLIFVRRNKGYKNNYRIFHRLLVRGINKGYIQKRNIVPYLENMMKDLSVREVNLDNVISDAKSISEVYSITSMKSCLNGIGDDICKFYERAGLSLVHFTNEYIVYRVLVKKEYGITYISNVYCNDNSMNSMIKQKLMELDNVQSIEELDIEFDLCDIRHMPYMDGFEGYVKDGKMLLTHNVTSTKCEGYKHINFNNGDVIVDLLDSYVLEEVAIDHEYWDIMGDGDIIGESVMTPFVTNELINTLELEKDYV